MKSLKARFLRERRKNKYLSDLIHFTKAIKNQKFTKRVLTKNLSNLVDKEDYIHLKASAKKELLNHLDHISNLHEDSNK